MRKLSVVVGILLAVSNVFAADWSDLSNGKHSFKSLGTAFYRDVPVRRIPNATVQLAFVNLEAVRRLGLELPSDPAKAEAMLLEHFAWEVDPEKKSEKVWFATHYLDANKKEVGGAIGDGRALWTGELQLKGNDGKILYVDGVQKGVGPTPFAWLNNASHSDGRQNTNELIISGIRSMADMGNELDSTADILGFTIKTPEGDIRSMTLRVGRQTRPAHIRYHSDNSADEAKIVDYIVKRDLGLPLTTQVTDAMFLEWERNFARNNAEDTARLFALNGFYEHPTMGNKTTTGGSIDLNGRQYMDAYHANLTHLYHRLSVSNQVSLQKGYIAHINGWLTEANYRTRNIDIGKLTKDMNQIFDTTFTRTAAKMLLRNLGLDDHEINSLPNDVRTEFYNAMNKLMRAAGNEPRKMYLQNDSTIPAAFDTRKILKGTLAAFAQPTAEQKAEAMKQLYRVDRQWNATNEGDHADLRERYERAVGSVVNALGGKIRPQWIQNAATRVKLERYDATTDGVWDHAAHPIRTKAESGQVAWPEISRLMQQAADTFIDKDPSVRKGGMLKPKLPIYAPSCSAVFANAG
jgi:hypothetical protein